MLRKYLYHTLFALLGSVFLTGCTEKKRARSYGGDTTITLECGEKLFNVTWKESNLWYVTRPMRAGEVPETYNFKEDSSWGVMEGSIKLVECAD